MTTIPFYTELPQFRTGDLLSATRLNQMLSNLDAVYGLDQRMSIGTTYGHSYVGAEVGWLGWVAYNGNQLKIYLQEAGTVEFDITLKHELRTETFASGGLKTIDLSGYARYQCYCIRVAGTLPPLYAYMVDSSAASIGTMPTFSNGATSTAADFNTVLSATGALAEQFNQPIVATSVWSTDWSALNPPSWLNDQQTHSIEFYMQHRHARLEFYCTAVSSSGQGPLDTIAWDVIGNTGGWHLFWAQEIPRPGSFAPTQAINIPLPTDRLTVGNWYRYRFSHNKNGSHEDGSCKLYFYGEQRESTAGLWQPLDRWTAGDQVHGSAGGPPQLDTMSDNLDHLDGRRHTTNPVMRKSTQDNWGDVRVERVFSKRIHRWLAYENATENATPVLYYTTDKLNVLASVTLPVSYSTVFLDFETTPVKQGMIFYVDNCNYAIQVPEHP